MPVSTGAVKSFSKNELLTVLDNINIRYEEQLQEPVSSDLVSNILSSKSNSMQNVIRLAKRVAPTKACSDQRRDRYRKRAISAGSAWTIEPMQGKTFY